MSDDAKQWRWVGEDGVEKSVSDQELIAELSAESLPNYTLVWHKGWGEWLPAMQVAELSWSLPPGKADDPVQPKEKLGGDSPPAPPLYRYPVLKRRAGTLKSDKPPPQKPAPHPPRPASATPMAAQAAAKGGAIPKPAAPKPKATAPKPPPQTTKPGLGGSPPVEKKPSIVRPGIATQLGLEVHVAAAKAAARAAQPEQGTQKQLSASVEAGPPTLLGALRVASSAAPTKSGVPHVAPPRSHPPPPPSLRKKPAQTETIEPDEEVAEVDAELEESRPENPSVEASEAALPIEPIESFEAETPHVHAYSEETDDDEETRVVPVRAEPPGPTYVAPHMPPPSEKAPAPPSTLPELPRIPPPPAPPSAVGEVNVLEVAKRLPPHIYALGGLVAILLLVVIVLAMAKGPDDSEDGKPAASAESSPPEEGADESQQGASRTDHPAPAKTQRAAAAGAGASKATDGCSVKTSAHKLADSAWLGVQPALGQVPGSTRVAIGYAASKSRAVGITIDPVTLDMDQVFREKRRNLVSVVPVGTDARLRFQVSDDSDKLKASVAVNASAPFALGLLEGAIARRSLQGGDAAAVWTTGAEEVTVPRVASSSSGHAVTMRSGGKAGKVFMGFLTPEGGQKTALWQVEDEKAFAGTPDIGVNETGVAVAFAARGGEDDAWAVHVARAASGQRPSRAVPFKLPPGGPGGNAISPVIAGLHGNSWLLQWTEGASGNRVVRIQTLGSRFEPRSDTINLSPQDANAGQGALWVDGETVVALFFVGSGEGHELWGASLYCPR